MEVDEYDASSFSLVSFPFSSSSSSSPPPPLPRTAEAETLAVDSGVPSVVRYALWKLERDREGGRESGCSVPLGGGGGGGGDDDDNNDNGRSLQPPSQPPPPPLLLRLLAVANAALIEAGRCWPEGEEEEEGQEGEEGDDGGKRSLARALSLPQRFFSPASSALPPLSYTTLRGAAARRSSPSGEKDEKAAAPPGATLRVVSLGPSSALVAVGLRSRSPSSPSASFPTAFQATVDLGGGGGGGGISELWRRLCDDVASPLAAAAAATASGGGVPQRQASLLGLPEDLLLEVLLSGMPRALSFEEAAAELAAASGRTRAISENARVPADFFLAFTAAAAAVAADVASEALACHGRKLAPARDLISLASCCRSLRDFVFGGVDAADVSAAMREAVAAEEVRSGRAVQGDAGGDGGGRGGGRGGGSTSSPSSTGAALWGRLADALLPERVCGSRGPYGPAVPLSSPPGNGTGLADLREMALYLRLEQRRSTALLRGMMIDTRLR